MHHNNSVRIKYSSCSFYASFCHTGLYLKLMFYIIDSRDPASPFRVKSGAYVANNASSNAWYERLLRRHSIVSLLDEWYLRPRKKRRSLQPGVQLFLLLCELFLQRRMWEASLAPP